MSIKFSLKDKQFVVSIVCKALFQHLRNSNVPFATACWAQSFGIYKVIKRDGLEMYWMMYWRKFCNIKLFCSTEARNRYITQHDMKSPKRLLKLFSHEFLDFGGRVGFVGAHCICDFSHIKAFPVWIHVLPYSQGVTHVETFRNKQFSSHECAIWKVTLAC